MNISVIIPTHNRKNLLLESLQSVMKQTRPADEIIIVDDASTDGTEKALQEFFTLIRYIHREHVGVSAARNTGIGAAKHDWLAFLDSDDLWQPEKLAKQEKALQKAPEYKICYTDEIWRRHGRRMNQSKKHRKYSGWIYQYCLPLCIMSPSSVLIHRSVFTQVGVFDESLPACEDYDLWLRISHRFPVLHIPEKLIVKRAGDWLQLSAQHSLDKYRIMALIKMLRYGGLGKDAKIQTRAMLTEKCRIYALGCRKHGRDDEVKWALETARTYAPESLYIFENMQPHRCSEKNAF